MNVTLGPGTSQDAPSCGVICYEAFKAIAEQHRFPPAFPNSEVATTRLGKVLLITIDHHEFDAVHRKGHFRFLWLRSIMQQSAHDIRGVVG